MGTHGIIPHFDPLRNSVWANLALSTEIPAQVWRDSRDASVLIEKRLVFDASGLHAVSDWRTLWP